MYKLYFDPSLTTGTMVFEGILLVILAFLFVYGTKNYRYFGWRFAALAIGVLFFELLTSSFWQIEHLGLYSYVNGDVSIIMTLLWTTVILSMSIAYDKLITNKSACKEIGSVVIASSILGGGILLGLKNLGVFSYSSLTIDLVNREFSILGIPVIAIVYFPLFITTCYFFFKYWETAMYNKHLFDNTKVSIIKDSLLATLLISLIGYLLHPMIQVGQSWYYGVLILLVILSLLITNFLISKASNLPLFPRFLIGSTLFGAFLGLILSYGLEYKLLSLAEITRNTYTENTFMIPGYNFTDAELVGIMLFSYLLIASLRYVKLLTDSEKIEKDEGNMTFRGWKSLVSK